MRFREYRSEAPVEKVVRKAELKAGRHPETGGKLHGYPAGHAVAEDNDALFFQRRQWRGADVVSKRLKQASLGAAGNESKCRHSRNYTGIGWTNKQELRYVNVNY